MKKADLSIEMKNLLEKIKIFKREITSVLGIFDFENTLNDKDIKTIRQMRMIALELDFDKKRVAFEDVLELLEALEAMLSDNYVFTDFEILSNFLVYFNSRFNLNDKEKKNLIFDFVERNINIGILSENALIIKKEFIKGNKASNDTIDIEELKKIDGFMESAEDLTKDIQESHKTIKNCYLDKKQKTGELKNFTTEDVEKIKLSLKKLNINDEIINSIMRVLNEKVSKAKAPSNFSYIRKDNKTKIKLSKKEYREIDIELRKYFYFDSNTSNVSELNNSIFVYQSLTEKEIMRCIFLLTKGGYDISTIETFLTKVRILNLNDKNLVNLYKNDFVLMFESFSERYNFAEKLLEANEIIKILDSMPNNSNEYLEWLEELKRLINVMESNISNEEQKEYFLRRIKAYKQKEKWN